MSVCILRLNIGDSVSGAMATFQYSVSTSSWERFRISRRRLCLGKEKGNGSPRDRYYLSSGTHCLSNAVSIPAMYVMNGGK